MSKQQCVQQFFVGKPIDLDDLLITERKRHDWLGILSQIPKGYGREVTFTYCGARNALKKLEVTGKIKAGEFYTITRGKKDSKRVVFIVHRGTRIST